MKVVVQCSGGVESTTLIGLAIAKFGKQNVFPIAFDTGGVFWNHRDSIAVKRVITNFQLQQNLFVCKMPQVDELEYVRAGDYLDVGFIPGFKMLFNTASMAYAHRVGASEVWIGNMGDNVFPDEEPKFLTDLAALYNRTYGMEAEKPISIETPFSAMTKAQVIKIAVEHGIDIFDTVSCGDERIAGGLNCGDCPWCYKRRDGFAAAGIIDKTRYMFDDSRAPKTYVPANRYGGIALLSGGTNV